MTRFLIRILFACAMISVVACDPAQAPLVERDSVSLETMTPDTGACLGTSAVLRFSYSWNANVPNSSLVSVVMQFDRMGGGAGNWTLLDEQPRFRGRDSGVIALMGLDVDRLKKPVCGRLLLTETIQDSLVAILARSGDFCWKEKP